MNVLAYDLGGTKVSAGIVTKNGKIIGNIRENIDFNLGKKALIEQMSRIGWELMKKERVQKTVGLASAGPMDAPRGLLLDPTNFKTDGKSWGIVRISALLKTKLKKNILLENDADAAAIAEHWIGAAKNKKNSMTITLGTGVGTGMICNGKLFRGGRDVHPEGGHVIIRAGDREALCGCGNYGCAEAYLSGTGFAKRASKKLGKDLTAFEIAEYARSGDPKALALFEEYAELLAATLRTYIIFYAPEIIVLAGSFSKAHDLFLNQTKIHLEKLMERRRKGIDLLPQIKLSKLGNDSGLIGAAYLAFNAK